uniref:Protein ENHANCED DISEASE RESISTANCE 2-like n=1 Tax=Davidia involucrata TaxID=16924 RepID=A0A5B7AM44_DAVIN
MGMPQPDGKMEGWLYLIRFNRFGLQYSRKRYFILEDNCLKSFKSKPSSDKEEALRSAIIDSCIRVMDNGRESYHRKVFFIFTLYNTSDQKDQLKLGASSSEEAARWIRSLQDAAINPAKNFVGCSKRKWQPFRLIVSKRTAHKKSVDWTSASSMHVDAMTSDVIAPSPWKIFGCQNGLRLFKEAKDRDFGGRHWDDHPAIMAVGVVNGTSEAVFRTLMSLGPSRSEWDFCFYRGCMVEHLDGHTDIVHEQLYNEWLPWGMKRRDLLLRRCWRREDDGTYVILYHSVFHRKCPPQSGYVRAWLKSGGYVITPVKQGKESVVKHMLAIDWKSWKSYIRKAYARSITISMLGRVAALRELFKAKAGNYSSDFSSGELTRDMVLLHSEKEDIKMEVQNPQEQRKVEEDKKEDEPDKLLSRSSSLMGLNDATDEFFDVPEPLDDNQLKSDWPSDLSPGLHYPEIYQPKLSSAAGFVKKLHDLAVQRKGYMDLQEVSREDNDVSCCYGDTLPKDPSCTLPCSWTTADPSEFLIRGDNYLEDHQKIKAKGTLMQMVAADWLKSDKREVDLGGRPGGIVQKYATQGGPEFFFIVNIQIPGTTKYTLAFYYMMKTPLEETPLLERFVNGDDSFRNSRFKLIPSVSKGAWIVKQSVRKKSCLVGQALGVNYYRGKNYLELEIDVGSSTVARGVMSLVLGYLNNLVIEIAFLIQANTQEELPEFLLGTCKFSHLDASKAVPVKP